MAEAVTHLTRRQGPLDVETITGSGERFLPALRRGLSKFLAIPLVVLAGFFVAGVLVYALDKAGPGWIEPLRGWLQARIFADSQTTGDFMGVAAGGLLTQTSIVISMLLIVLQQTASNMGNLVYDHFMERRHNQLYVGYVIGSVVLAFFLASTVSDSFNPVLGGTLVLLVTFLSVALLAWFLYTTMNQMKPEVLLTDIHGTAMRARKNDLSRLSRTRRESISTADVQVTLRSTSHGYVTHLDLDKIATCLKGQDQATEIVIHAIIGDFVSYRDIIAEIKSRDPAGARAVAEHVGSAFILAREREPDSDSRFNLEELEMMAWTEGSTAKQNPETSLMVVHILRDLLRRWMLEDLTPSDVQEPLPVVYPDRVIERTIDAFESLAVVSTESKQHQVFAEVLEALALTYRDLPHDLRQRIDSLLWRVVPGLAQHFYTTRLQQALDHMTFTLRDVGNDETAGVLVQARDGLAQTAGHLSMAGVERGGDNGQVS